MTQDWNKGIDAIAYNHLNLPTRINFKVDQGEKFISYIYNALGQKVSKQVVHQSSTEQVNTVTEYLSGYQYVGGILQLFPTAEGYVSVTNGKDFDYVYNYTDHLGNIRVSYTMPKGSTTLSILEENHYYPFGMKHANYGDGRHDYVRNPDGTGYAVIDEVHRNKYQYKYNGKEFQDELSLNLYDYGWRNYDPAIGRWMNMDNLAEKYISASPYHYAGNNPVLNFDIDGNEFTEGAWDWVNRLVSNINSRQETNNASIAEKRAKLEKGNLKSSEQRRLNRQIGDLESNNAELENVRGEIATLASSNQVYDVITDKEGTQKNEIGATSTTNSTSMNFKNGNIEITVSNGTGLDLFAHELKHAYQFEMGEASYGQKNGRGFSFLLDQHDELAGYQRQGLFGSDGSVRYISSLPSEYKNLPTGPISIHNISPAIRNIVQKQNNIQLQSLANQRKQAFRVNNKTFIPNTEN